MLKSVTFDKNTSLIFIAAILLLTGCKDGAEAFFTGRPSEMAMVHNRIISGPPETMVALLQVPIRFPDATESHIENWQESIIAWWWHPEKQKIISSSLSKISPEEINTLKTWVKLRAKYRNTKKAQALDEIETAIQNISKQFQNNSKLIVK